MKNMSALTLENDYTHTHTLERVGHADAVS